MTRQEIIDAVRALDGGKLSEGGQDELIISLDRSLPHSNVVDLIFFHKPELSADEIADEAIRREAEWKERNA